MDVKELEYSDYYISLSWLSTYLWFHKGFVAGGCFKNIFNKEKIKDIDIFFRNEGDCKEAIIEFRARKEFEFIYETKKVIAFQHKGTKITCELIKIFFGTPYEIIEDFDFTIVKFAYERIWIETVEDSAPEYETTIICHENYFEHLHLHKLVIDDEVQFPFSTFERSLKYKQYGYSLCRESKIKLIKAIRNPDIVFNDIDLSASLYDGFD